MGGEHPDLWLNVLCRSQQGSLHKVLRHDDCCVLSFCKGLSKCRLSCEWATNDRYAHREVECWRCIWWGGLGHHSDVMDGSPKWQIKPELRQSILQGGSLLICSCIATSMQWWGSQGYCELFTMCLNERQNAPLTGCSRCKVVARQF